VLQGPRYVHQPIYGDFRNHSQGFAQPPPLEQEASRIVDAVTIFKRPGRLARPDRFVVILRGLPGIFCSRSISWASSCSLIVSRL
jgi:hypothetical protein